MSFRAALSGTMVLWACAACSIDREVAAEESSDSAQQGQRVKDRVLEVVCDPDSRSTPEELVPLVREVRVRDGSSDRVWEVADEADCISGPASTEPTVTD